MAKYTLRQYRSAVKQFFKTIDEFVSYKGRTYSTKYYEVKQKIEIFENAIKRKTYSNSELANMMRILNPKSKSWVLDYVVQYDPEKDKFTSTVSQPRYEKREGEVPSVGEVKREAIKEYNKQFEDEDEENVNDYGDTYDYGDEEDEEDEEEIPDWYGELYNLLIEWCVKRFPWTPAVDLLDALIRLKGRKDLIIEFERQASETGIDLAKIDSTDAEELRGIADKIYIDSLYDNYDDDLYDNTDFGDYE